ncbi:hypothetical protein VHEMI02201 [[Torrubiella] hemipterigena]|uniref:Uncharacterized protein n=1 Tax=[Torrubiella] hemipterigena TaxID=1531966 RepID=A0A0A1T7I8_9HYPO|nr:hypothetical protein VHEMI02201 [[Torrubiella] hemipterigena]
MTLQNHRFSVADLSGWSAALKASTARPVLVHLNADTTWLIQLPLPNPSATRTHFNLLIDPWLRGPQSDVASWFSTQWHVVAPSVDTLANLNQVLCALETGNNNSQAGGKGWFIDAVAVSHEFTDHCHKATLLELPPTTTVFAADLAADLIRSWNHFDVVTTTPGFVEDANWQDIEGGSLPSWLRIGRVITPNNSLYYHSAVIIAFDLSPTSTGEAEAMVYSPHGIEASDLSFLASKSSLLSTLALLHGLHDVSIMYTKQLNLGGLNGIDAVRASGAKYWIATHDEIKKGGGIIAPLLMRTQYTVDQANQHDQKHAVDNETGYKFLDLASGDGYILV